VNVTLQHAQLRVEGLKLENGLVVDLVTVEAEECSFNAATKSYAAPKGGTLEAYVSAGSVRRFLEDNPPENVKDLDILLGEGRIVVTAKMQAIISVGVTATGHLVARDGTRIEFEPTEVKVAGFGAPGGLVDSALAGINPLLDLSGLPLPIVVTDIAIQPTSITFQATIGPA